jgi:hypothetical protein
VCLLLCVSLLFDSLLRELVLLLLRRLCKLMCQPSGCPFVLFSSVWGCVSSPWPLGAVNIKARVLWPLPCWCRCLFVYCLLPSVPAPPGVSVCARACIRAFVCPVIPVFIPARVSALPCERFRCPLVLCCTPSPQSCACQRNHNLLCI